MRSVAGVDEAGRGPLAGPVVAAAVILPPHCDHHLFRDSKKLSANRREELFALLERMEVPVGVGIAGPAEIEAMNILHASLYAMKLAVESLATPPDYLLVDGKFPVPIIIRQHALVKGESKSASIAAASIVAKVTRDRIMMDYHRQFPHYNFHKHKGYPTREHKRLIARYGPCEIHRRGFKGVREVLEANDVR